MSKKLKNEQQLRGYRGLRGPAWRLELLGQLISSRMHRLAHKTDPYVRDAHHFWLLCARGDSGTTRAKARYSAIAAAFAFHQDEAKCTAAKILTLGGCERNEIAARLGDDEQVLEKWESLFFDVRECREAVGWIQVHVIQPEHDRDNDQLASKMKAAVAGGPAAARAILDLESRVPVTAGEKLFDRKLALHLKFDAAVELPLTTNREKMFFIKLRTDLRFQEQRLKLAERKFEQRCTDARDKQQLAEIRRELAEQRAATRAASRARREHERVLVRAGVEQQRAFLAARQEAQPRAEWEAAAARAAACPLSALTWGSTAGSAALASKDEAVGAQPANESVCETVMPVSEEAELAVFAVGVLMPESAESTFLRVPA